DVERSDEDDEAKHHEHRDALDLQRLEQRGVHLPPVNDDAPSLDQLAQRRDDVLHLVGIGRLDFDLLDLVAHEEQFLRILHRHDHEGLVVIVDANLEDGSHRISDLARDGADHGRPAFRMPQGDLASRIGPERIGKPRAERNLAAPWRDRTHVARKDIAHDRFVAPDVLYAHATDDYALEACV